MSHLVGLSFMYCLKDKRPLKDVIASSIVTVECGT